MQRDRKKGVVWSYHQVHRLCKYRFKCRSFRKIFWVLWPHCLPEVFLDRNVLIATVREAQLRLCFNIDSLTSNCIMISLSFCQVLITRHVISWHLIFLVIPSPASKLAKDSRTGLMSALDSIQLIKANNLTAMLAITMPWPHNVSRSSYEGFHEGHISSTFRSSNFGSSKLLVETIQQALCMQDPKRACFGQFLQNAHWNVLLCPTLYTFSSEVAATMVPTLKIFSSVQ